MKLTLRQLIESREALITVGKKDLPANIAWRYARNCKLINPELETYQEAVKKLWTTYGEPVLDKDGKPTDQMKVTPERRPEFEAEIKKLLNETVELAIAKININELSGTFQALELMALDWMLDAPEE